MGAEHFRSHYCLACIHFFSFEHCTATLSLWCCDNRIHTMYECVSMIRIIFRTKRNGVVHNRHSPSPHIHMLQYSRWYYFLYCRRDHRQKVGSIDDAFCVLCVAMKRVRAPENPYLMCAAAVCCFNFIKQICTQAKFRSYRKPGKNWLRWGLVGWLAGWLASGWPSDCFWERSQIPNQKLVSLKKCARDFTRLLLMMTMKMLLLLLLILNRETHQHLCGGFIDESSRQIIDFFWWQFPISNKD